MHMPSMCVSRRSPKLRINDVVPADRGRRSPSPEPQYDSSGKRINTRYRRYRDRLEDERHALVQVAMRTIPSYRPPQSYVHDRGRRGMIKEKVYIPAKDFQDVNFIGQLLGPRGRSLADMNAQSGANIVIRGKGSVKEGKGRCSRRARNDTNDDQDEPLHCLITADAQEKVDKAKALVQAVIETAVTTPELANERKRQQLRDLAVVNGTFRDDEGHGIGGSGRDWKRPMATGIVCRVCSGGGHIARNCPDRKARVTWRNPPWREANRGGKGGEDVVDLAYSQFLLEVGGNTVTKNHL
ncbi:hypothetical protein QBC33DRAFT_550663 [Phialemonium atrogriseum]|uniref:Branchpoint-bridging protein n=1 Tax=Phialemonium atrogriseum TaxID=1093897 RepID=A0AAJ0FBX7_9PEZI|nr:uncharacterized protein QBC33DRAFT_550663 [Phialemonium atrogriseum]KAK1762986.1 hypothetical protein QBC33DRAFT_550663 [Phialemonium atrogriseum]